MAKGELVKRYKAISLHKVQGGYNLRAPGEGAMFYKSEQEAFAAYERTLVKTKKSEGHIDKPTKIEWFTGAN